MLFFRDSIKIQPTITIIHLFYIFFWSTFSQMSIKFSLKIGQGKILMLRTADCKILEKKQMINEIQRNKFPNMLQEYEINGDQSTND